MSLQHAFPFPSIQTQDEKKESPAVVCLAPIRKTQGSYFQTGFVIVRIGSSQTRRQKWVLFFADRALPTECFTALEP